MTKKNANIATHNFPITADGITENLNNLIEAAVADPYHIPDFADAFVAAGYLEPDSRFAINDIKLV